MNQDENTLGVARALVLPARAGQGCAYQATMKARLTPAELEALQLLDACQAQEPILPERVRQRLHAAVARLRQQQRAYPGRHTDDAQLAGL